MNNLSKPHLIQKENLNEAFYFPSLLQECHRLNLFTVSEFESIQLQSIKLLAKQTERFTGGESSSVKVETAENIMHSILYCIGFYLRSFPDINMSIEALKQKTLLELYRSGKQMMRERMGNANKLLYAIQHDGFVTDNQAYNDTIQNGIPDFFSAYDIDLAAHDTPGSIDYPLSNDQMNLVGIEYIYSYLQKLFLENQFCNLFPMYDIECLLRSYDEHYQDLLINIFGLVLTNAIGSVLAKKNAFQLKIEPLDRQYLRQKLLNLPKAKLDTMLQDAATKLCQQLNISNRVLQDHIAATLLDLSARVTNALEINQLESIFISFKENDPLPVFQFEDGEKVSDESFRSIVDEIRECRFVSDKIAIIQREIHSFADLVDLLEGYCIFDDEFAEIFPSLGDMELAFS